MSEREREEFRLRHFGFIFQGYNLFPALNARQQLELVVQWGEGTGRREARRRSERVLDLLGLGAKGHLRPTELSGGEKQRVAIGRALVIVELLQHAAHERGATILVVTHDPRLIPYADRVFGMEDGHLCEQGPNAPPCLIQSCPLHATRATGHRPAEDLVGGRVS
jgi:putative ABC transport system ATP-binding protein